MSVFEFRMSSKGVKRLGRSLTLVLCLSACLGAAQGESLKKRVAQGNASSVVSQLDASVAFDRVETVLFRLTGLNTVLPRIPASALPVRRGDIITRFDRIFELLKPKFNFTPRKIKFDPKSLAFSPTHPQRAAVEKLIRWGCISKSSPLATSKNDAVRAADFGEALGVFMMRIADLTHKPDPRFSPFIGGGIS